MKTVQEVQNDIIRAQHQESYLGTGQGTRLSEKAPWETYETEMDVKMSKELADAVERYSENRYEANQTSNQNKEVLAEERELSAMVAKEHQWLKPEEYEDLEARIGKVMSHADFISKLRSAGVKCHYRQHVHADKVVLYVQPPKAPAAEYQIACWVQNGLMPELSIMNFDDHGAPLAERRRGWRTCLLQLILGGFITEEAANKAFGKPKESFQYHRYNSMLKAFRDAGSSLGE